MSKNSAADCPRLYVRSSQQLREFKVSNELLTHRVVITLCCSSHIVTFAIHTFNLHKILCLCCFVPLLELGAKVRHLWEVEKKLLSQLLATYLQPTCNLLPITPCTFPLPHCSLCGKPVRISAVHNWSLRYAVFLAPCV